jgi:hypothetical protein
MEHANNKRSDITLRQSIDGYLAYIQKSFKDAMYTSGSWDEDALSKFCQGVRVTNRGDLLTISSGQKKVHAYIATKNINGHDKGSIFSAGWFGKPSLSNSIGNVLEGAY